MEGCRQAPMCSWVPLKALGRGRLQDRAGSPQQVRSGVDNQLPPWALGLGELSGPGKGAC